MHVGMAAHQESVSGVMKFRWGRSECIIRVEPGGGARRIHQANADSDLAMCVRVQYGKNGTCLPVARQEVSKQGK